MQNTIEKRVVAFLDILGFKEMIKSIPLNKLVDKYEGHIKQVKNFNRPHTDYKGKVEYLFPNHPTDKFYCDFFIFSDSIILISNDDSEESCFKLLVYIWRLTQLFLAGRMPIRGGISYGEIYINKELNVFVGEALTDAYELERQQNWIGVAIDKSIELNFKKLIEQNQTLFKSLFMKYDIPLKDGSTKNLHTINWRFNMVVEDGTRSLFSSSIDEKIATKVKNTLEYAKKVRTSGRVYAKNYPVELGKHYILSDRRTYSQNFVPTQGFSHGDEL